MRVDQPTDSQADLGARTEGPKQSPADDRDGTDDHLDALLFAGTSVGASVPGLSSLYLAVGPTVDRDLLHVHEMAHRMLFDDSAWGAALHMLHAEGERNHDKYREYLEATRRTHEGWATFASVQVAEHIHPDVKGRVLARPTYAAYLDQFETLLASVDGASRRYYAAWAVACACSRTAVLRTLVTRDGDVQPVSAVPLADRPDVRLGLLFDLLPSHAASYALVADAAFARLEGRDPYVRLDTEASDASWLAWVDSFEQSVCELLIAVGAEMPGADDYLADAVALQQRLPTGHRGRDLTVGSASSETSDAVWLHENLLATRWPIVRGLRRGRYGDVNTSIDTPELVDLIEQTATASHGLPELTLHLRLTRRLLSGWDWDSRSIDRLSASGGDLRLCARVSLIDEDSGQPEILHVGLPDLVRLLRVWAHRGPVTAVLTTSAFLSPEATRWLEALVQVADIVMLVDVSVQNLLSGDAPFLPAEGPLSLRHVGLTNEGLDVLQWAIPGQGFLGVLVADGISVDLIRDLLSSARVTDAGSAGVWERWDASAQRALRSLLATESFFDLRGAVGPVTE